MLVVVGSPCMNGKGRTLIPGWGGVRKAVDYIHANEVILTFGYSHSTLLFLTEAAKKRNFQVVSLPTCVPASAACQNPNCPSMWCLPEP